MQFANIRQHTFGVNHENLDHITLQNARIFCAIYSSNCRTDDEKNYISDNHALYAIYTPLDVNLCWFFFSMKSFMCFGNGFFCPSKFRHFIALISSLNFLSHTHTPNKMEHFFSKIHCYALVVSETPFFQHHHNTNNNLKIALNLHQWIKSTHAFSFCHTYLIYEMVFVLFQFDFNLQIFYKSPQINKYFNEHNITRTKSGNNKK